MPLATAVAGVTERSRTVVTTRSTVSAASAVQSLMLAPSWCRTPCPAKRSGAFLVRPETALSERGRGDHGAGVAIEHECDGARAPVHADDDGCAPLVGPGGEERHRIATGDRLGTATG